jgi:hypothetical protein
LTQISLSLSVSVICIEECWFCLFHFSSHWLRNLFFSSPERGFFSSL